MSISEFSLKWGKEKRLANGYAWAFRNEIDLKEKDPGPGALVRLKTHKGRPLGVGFLNTHNTLSFRLLARHGEFPLDATAEAIVAARLRQALDLRGPRAAGAARRLVFSEGDALSGLVVDDYNGVLALQLHSAGLEKQRAQIESFLKGEANAKALIERSDDGFRAKEGLTPSKGLRFTQGLDEDFLSAVPFTEGGAQYLADCVAGHKTGFFLDQAPSRALARSLAAGRDCLDLFCHSGGFGVAMALGGATSVMAMDQSQDALALAKKHATLNQVQERCAFEAADLFTRLREMEKDAQRYGLIVLDPPALAKEGEAAGGALRGYRELNLRALRLLRPGGLLLSCSCTAAVSEGQFYDAVQSAALDAPASLRVLQRLGAGSDHPARLGQPETSYLKCLLLRKD
jgi:23S rRNA (cytosine1962-C5)-methyltransferase